MKKTLPLYAFITISCLCIAIGFRLYPLLSFTKSGASERATLYVISKIKQNIQSQVEKSFPDKTISQKKLLAKKLFDQYLREKGPIVRKNIEQVTKDLSMHLKSGRSTPYLLASDSFYYLSLTKNILNTGHISNSIKGSKYFNSMMLAPSGFWEPLNLHPYLGVFVYKFLSLLSPSIDLMFALSFVPILISSLCLLIFIALLHHLRVHLIINFIASVFFMLAPIFMKRSMFGWYDNDPYNILFPLLALYLFFLCFANLNNGKKWIGFAVLSVLTLGIYAYFWQGWIFTLSILSLSCLGIYILQFILKDSANRKELLSILAIIVGGSFLWTAITFGPKEFAKLFSEGYKALTGFLNPQLSAWPDMFISVSELYRSDLSFLSEQLGGPFFICIALLGFLSLFTKAFREQRYVSVTLVLYGSASVFIALGAQRFVMLALIPFSVCFAFGLQTILCLTSILFKKRFSSDAQQNFIRRFVLTILLTSICLPIVWLKTSIASLLNPLFNQTWEEVLNEVAEKTPKESIINTWWPPGHFVKAVAGRSVTFDGATINVPQAYWMANVFLSPTEEEALGLLRMLNSSGNKAAEQFVELGLDLPTSVSAIKDLVKRPKEEAHEILFKVFKHERGVNHILSLTHGTPPPSYLLVYKEFVENNLQLKFIGQWNFKAIQALNADPKKLQKVPKRNSPEFIQFLWALSGGPHRYSGPLAQISSEDDSVIFQENISLNKNKLLAHVDSPKYGKGIPASIFYLKDGTIREKKLPGANLSYSLLLYERGNASSVVLLDRYLAQSLLIKLYFFEGKGLKYIKPFIHKRDLTGRTDIYVFKINWPAFIASMGN